MDRQAVPAHLVLVHGLWMGRWSIRVLQHRLQAAGFTCHRFGYPSVRRPFADNLADLRAFVDRLPGARPGFVAHSFGGLLVLRLLAERPPAATGRLVTLGSPVQGSTVARQLAARGWLARRWLGGALSAGGLLDPAPPPPPGWAWGALAGDRPRGVGSLVARLERPHDGTVGVAETRHPGQAEHRCLPVSHAGLLLSPAVARQAAHFLRHECFVP